jgi:large subunit ribosomal protein L4
MATSLKQVDAKGKAKGAVDASDAVFGLEPNVHVMHLAVRRELANARSGSANAKTRAEVSGGGKKPWKQKGTGRARAGSNRSPLWKGGGVIFGPKPRDFDFDIPKKVRRLAVRSAFSAANTKVHVVSDFGFLASPKTKDLSAFVSSISAEATKFLILADYKATENKNLQLASRNLPTVKLRLPGDISVKDLIEADCVILTQAALDLIQERYQSDVSA